MKNAIILHGTGGSPEGNWFRWLEAELQKNDLDVWLPALPHADHPSLREELDFVHEHCPFPIDHETLVIGHSSGAILALLLAQEDTKKLGAVVAVSVFHDNSLDWSANDRLFDVPFDWAKICASEPNIICVHSDDDPYVPLDQARYVADNVHAELLVIPGQGHFNLEKSHDYTAFPLLLSLLKERGIIKGSIIQIVDEEDRPLRGGTMHEVQAKGSWHRIVHIMVEDDAGNVLLQKRAPVMFMNPDRWDDSSSGHADVGETWPQAARRELEEEVGLNGVDLTERRRYKTEEHESDGRIIRRFNVLYRTIVPHTTVFAPQAEEVSGVRWFSRGKLRALVTQHPDEVSDGLIEVYKIMYKTKPLIQIVDENDVPVRGGTKLEAQKQGLWHRIVKIVLRDSAGNILLQRRGEHVLSPGCWDFSAAGHVDIGEDYLDAACRELVEEIGVTGVKLHKIDSVKYDKTDKDGRIFRRFAVTYVGQIDHDYAFKLDPREVAEIRWMTLEEAKTLARTSPDTVTSGLRQILEGDLVK